MAIVFLALGTNLGDRLANIRRALQVLPPKVKVLARSHVYETPAWGYEAQPDFLNLALKAETSLEPPNLLAYLKQIELQLGREPSPHWGPRLIDIDILFYDDRFVSTPGLAIPHLRLHERAFVLVPLAEIAPDLIHPVLGSTISDLLADVDRSGIRLYSKQL